MDPVNLNMKIISGWTGGLPEWRTLRVTGRPEEPYVPLVEQAARDFGIPDGHDGLGFIDYDDPEFEVRFTLMIDSRTSLREVLAVVGDDATAEPPTLQAGFGGRGAGGGFEPPLPEYLISHLRLAVELWGYGTITLGAWKLGVKRYFSGLRRLAADWVRTGVLDDELREKVLSRRQWSEHDLDKVFALSLESKTSLLTQLGYEYSPADGGTWVDTHSEEVHNETWH